jgi:hypothetical protein
MALVRVHSFLILVVGALACFRGVAVASQDETNPTRNIVELQIGGGLLSGAYGTGPIAQAQARFALWRSIGLGLYAGGAYTGDDRVQGVVPACGRLNLSLPFWESFEPVLALGAGYYTYFVDSSTGETKSEGEVGYHVALALLFPHKKHGFGVEGALHVTADPLYSDEANGFGTLVVTMLIR